MPHFCRSYLDHWDVSLNVHQVSSSYKGQWISLYFSVDASNSFLGQQDIKLYLENHATYICINLHHCVKVEGVHTKNHCKIHCLIKEDLDLDDF